MKPELKKLLEDAAWLTADGGRIEIDAEKATAILDEMTEARRAIEAMRVCIVYARDRRGGAFDFDTWIQLVDAALSKGELPPHAIEEAQAEVLVLRAALKSVQKQRNELRAENERLMSLVGQAMDQPKEPTR